MQIPKYLRQVDEFRKKDAEFGNELKDLLTRYGLDIPVDAENRPEVEEVIFTDLQSQNEVKLEREVFEGIFNNIPVMITIYDPGLKNFRFNREYVNLLGWIEEDAADGNFMAKVYPDPEYRKQVSDYMQSLKTGWKEWILTARDGKKLASSWANILLTSGTQIGIGIDLTQIKKAEEKLREREQRLQIIFNNAAIGIVEVDSEDRFIDVNDRICNILGYSREELLGKSISEITFHEDKAYSEDMNLRLHKGEFGLFNYEKRYIRKDGTPLWVHVTVSSIRDLDGFHIRSIGTIEDISERKHSEEKLRESEEKFRLLFENITEGVAIHELVYEHDNPIDYMIVDVNPAYQKYTGIEMKNARDKLASELYGFVPYLNEYSDVAEHKRSSFRFERYFHEIQKHFAISVISPKKGQFATVFEDITEQKKIEQEMHLRNEELTRFIYTVSHDLKSPLVTIKSFTSYLKEDIELNDKAAQEKDINYIQNAADKMGKLLDELLELSRIGRKEEPKSYYSLESIASSAIDLVAGRISNKKVRVTISGPPTMLYGHYQRLVQLYQNLIDNAVKFMGGQQDPFVELGSIIKAGTEEITLFVRDNGQGIDPRHSHKLFGLFEKLDNATEGTGIGLALVKRIIEVHDGTIWFTSEGTGKGTTFFFSLDKTYEIKQSN